MSTRLIEVANKDKLDEIEMRQNRIETLFQVNLIFTTRRGQDVDAAKHTVMVSGWRIDCQNAAMYIDTLTESNKPETAFVFLNSFITDEMVMNVERQSVAVVCKEKGNSGLYRIMGNQNQMIMALDLLEEISKEKSKEKANSVQKNDVSRRLSASLQNSIVKSSRKVSNCVNAPEKVKRAILGGLDSMNGTNGEDKSGDDKEQDVILISDSEDEEVFKDAQVKESEIDDKENDTSLMIIDTPEPKRDTEKRVTKNVNSDVIRKLTCDFQNMQSPSGPCKKSRPIPGESGLCGAPREDQTKTAKGHADKSAHCNTTDEQAQPENVTTPSTDNICTTKEMTSSKFVPFTVRSLIRTVITPDQSKKLMKTPSPNSGNGVKMKGPDEMQQTPVNKRKIKKAKKSSKKKSKETGKTKEQKLEIPKDIANEKLKKKKSKKRKRDKKEKEKTKSKNDKDLDSDPEPGEIEEERPEKARRIDDSGKKAENIIPEPRLQAQIGTSKAKRVIQGRPHTTEALRYIVIDGSNVAMSHGKKGVFSCRGLRLCVEFFKKRGHKLITIFLPMWRKCRVPDPSTMQDRYILDNLEDEGYLVYTPSRKIGNRLVASYDDRFILELADRENGIVVSNDQYRDLLYEKASWTKVIQERLLQYLFVNDHFMVPDDPLGRHGPNLDTFLRNTYYDRDVAARFQNDFKTLK